MPVVDCRTGEARLSRPRDYITKLTAVAAAPPGTPAPLWEHFLNTTFPLPDHSGPDVELIGFLKRWVGYCTTGLVHEHKFLSLYSTGRSGKNVFVDTISGVLGDYAVRLPSEVLMLRPVEPHRAELMPLRGARLIVCNEIEKGARWHQSRLMAITSGDLITANAMRSNPVTFPIVGKLIVVGNNKPAFPNRNAAARDRLLLVHFKMHFKDEGEGGDSDLPPERIGVRDPQLSEKLRRNEWPAILRWAIDGCLEWQRIGLRPPASVLADSADTLAADDSFLEWKADRCAEIDRHARGRDLIALLSRSFNDWATANKQTGLSRPEFSALLDDHEVERHRVKKGFCALGLELAPEERERLTGQRELNS
jgi:putative DNA primase/helicase